MEYDSRGRARKLGSLNDLQMVDKLIVLSHNSLLLRNESTHEAFKVCVCVCVCVGGGCNKAVLISPVVRVP